MPTIALTGLSAAQKRALAIADNKLALNAGWDDELLRLELGELGLAGFDLSLIGFTDLELRYMLDEPAFDPVGPEDQGRLDEKAYCYMPGVWPCLLPRPELRLDWCGYEAARYSCERWHYAHIVPRNKLAKIGVWEDGAFRGTVVFGPGASDALGNAYGLTSFQCCELVRIALRDHSTSVSRIVRFALMLIQPSTPGLRLIVSFADPAYGHHGGIYQGANWIYTGMTSSSDELIVHGRKMHGRAVRKTLEV